MFFSVRKCFPERLVDVPPFHLDQHSTGKGPKVHANELDICASDEQILGKRKQAREKRVLQAILDGAGENVNARTNGGTAEEKQKRRSTFQRDAWEGGQEIVEHVGDERNPRNEQASEEGKGETSKVRTTNRWKNDAISSMVTFKLDKLVERALSSFTGNRSLKQANRNQFDTDDDGPTCTRKLQLETIGGRRRRSSSLEASSRPSPEERSQVKELIKMTKSKIEVDYSAQERAELCLPGGRTEDGFIQLIELAAHQIESPSSIPGRSFTPQGRRWCILNSCAPESGLRKSHPLSVSF
ncbi:hypothetical protein B0H13DRAFT_1866396 [Mycena leptocephala]|nr:hypothetical protein B0H13DRAFT_1866396 [Mycena leptocephala]